MLFLMMFLNISKENLSNKKSAAQELQSPEPPLKKKGIFSPSFRMVGHSHSDEQIICRVSRSLFSADCLMFNWYHSEMSFFEHQTAGTRRRRAKHQPIFLCASFRCADHNYSKSITTMPAVCLMLKGNHI